MYLFTSESVSPGHPDKCADIISDALVDAYLIKDKESRIAAEVFFAGNNIIVGGEIKSKASFTNTELKDIIINTVKDIGYKGDGTFSRDEVIYPDDLNIQILLKEQSPDINQCVDKASGEIGAGDQGIMFGYADIETEEFMPSAISYARLIQEDLYNYALEEPSNFGIDIKTQVTMDYETKENFENANPISIHSIVVSIPSKLAYSNIEQFVIRRINNWINIPSKLLKNTIFYINPSGTYINHSPLFDTGLTGRKLIVDSFGGYSPIGGGAQSSKDYTKVDRSGLYAARWIAKNIVASGLAKKCIVQLSYAIGIPHPISISVDTMGTYINKEKDDNYLSNLIMNKYSLTPSWINNKFKLDTPSKDTFFYKDVAAKGQVGKNYYPWEIILEKEKINEK